MSSVMLLSILLVISAVLITGNEAMNCYYCAGPLGGDCANGNTEEMIEVGCGRDSLDYAMETNHMEPMKQLYFHCVKFERPLPGRVTAFVRGCSAMPQPGDPCAYLEKRIRAQNCVSCNTTLCNRQVDEPAVYIADFLYTGN